MVTIKPCSTAEILNHSALISEYADECAIAGMPRPNPSKQIYEQLEQAGMIHCFGAYKDESMIGFATLLVSMLPHYSRVTAITESLFVASKHRNSMAGIKLINTVIKQARRMQAVGVLVSAPTGGKLAKLLERMNLKKTNEVFFKCLT